MSNPIAHSVDEAAPGVLDHVRVRILPDGRMSRVDAAIYLGVKPKTLAMWALQGKGPTMIRVGGRVFYSQRTLDDFVRRGIAA